MDQCECCGAKISQAELDIVDSKHLDLNVYNNDVLCLKCAVVAPKQCEHCGTEITNKKHECPDYMSKKI